MRAISVFNVALAVFIAASGAAAQVAGSHTDLPRWCGKPYQSGSPNFNPGGNLEPPPPSPTQLLFVQVAPRHSIYVSSESTGSFIVDATLSHTHGKPYHNSSLIDQSTINARAQQPFAELEFTIAVQNTNEVLVASHVAINSTRNLFDFSFRKLTPRMDSYDVVLSGTSPGGNQAYTATAQLFYLPDKTTGSVTKVDYLNGGLLFKNNATNYEFEPLFPHGWYTDYSGYLQLSLENVQKYADLGFNVIHPVTAFMDSDNFTTIIDYMDQINLLWQYDMRGSFTNLTSVAEQVPLVMDHSSFLTYYTADEPDGAENALNSTKLAYDLITSMDKYHPISLVLNCQNFYYDQYSSGADFILEDAYPISINATHSRPFNTPCNVTYGDCGCDSCIGSLTDVPTRFDDLHNYQSWLAQWPSKPIWGVTQSFDGDYWERYPTADETWAMNQLGLNHGSKGVMLWIFPSLDELNTANSQQAKVITVDPVRGFLTGTQPVAIDASGPGQTLDVSYWVVGNQALVSVVNLENTATTREITIPLPFLQSSRSSLKKSIHIASTPWGSVNWSLSSRKEELTVQGLAALATSMVIINL